MSETVSEARASTGAPQILQISPKGSLTFKGPSSLTAQSTITLTNPTKRAVAYKVKTTAPKRYCVRPNGGILTGADSIVIHIIYQPGEAMDPQERQRHKFLVQALFIEGDPNTTNLENLWRDARKESIMESKIRCVFEDTDEAVLPAAPQLHATTGADMDSSMEGAVQAAVATKSGISNTELELRRIGEDYRRAQDEIANLRDENKRLRDEGVRMRKTVAATAASSSTSTVAGGDSGRLAVHRGSEGLLADLTKVTVLGVVAAMFIFGILIGKVLF